MNLEAYFARTGYVGDRAPTLANLHAIAHAHVTTIPFENIDVLLGRPIALEPDALMQKLVHDRRGGYCFEQNGLMLEVLAALGYRVTPLSARVRAQRPRDYIPARTHLCVRVELDQPWLVDVGVGSMSIACAIRLMTEEAQATPHEPRRLLRENGVVYHQFQQAGEWHDVAELTLEEMPVIDRVVANWYTSTHPQSHFRARLTVARATDEGRVTILNDTLTIRGATTTKVQIESHAHLRELLGEHFGMAIDADVPFRF